MLARYIITIKSRAWNKGFSLSIGSSSSRIGIFKFGFRCLKWVRYVGWTDTIFLIVSDPITMSRIIQLIVVFRMSMLSCSDGSRLLWEISIPAIILQYYSTYTSSSPPTLLTHYHLKGQDYCAFFMVMILLLRNALIELRVLDFYSFVFCFKISLWINGSPLFSTVPYPLEFKHGSRKISQMNKSIL